MVAMAATRIRSVQTCQKRLPEFIADGPRRCERLRSEIGQVADAEALIDLWQDKVAPLLAECGDMLNAAPPEGRRGSRRPPSSRISSARQRRPSCCPVSKPERASWPVSARWSDWPSSPGARSTGTRSPASTGTAVRTRQSCRCRGRPKSPAGSTTSLPVLTALPATQGRCWRAGKLPAPPPGSGWCSATQVSGRRAQAHRTLGARRQRARGGPV